MYKEKSSKYKSKYLNLKKKLYGGAFNITDDIKYMTSNINSLADAQTYYLKQNLFSYWISSSHNTYLPFEQNIKETSLCYYNLQYMTYFGGCVEIDTYSVEDNNVMISHLLNSNKIKLTDILNIVMEALINKIEKKIVSGPFILNFDNSGAVNYLKTKEQQKVFWDNIYSSLLDTDTNLVKKYREKIQNQFPVLFINKTFDLSQISIEDMNYKILFRWGSNKKKCKDKTVGHELCSPEDTQAVNLEKFRGTYYEDTSKWVHLDKNKDNYTKQFVTTKNISQSTSSPAINTGFTELNIFTIINSQRNLLRMYPHWNYTSSGNYHNMKYFRDGVQITALNLQTIDDSRLLNDAVFIPPNFNYCTIENIKKNDCVNQNLILSYRLKPLWLLGLIPYPSLYDLEITIKPENQLNSDLNFIYGLDNKISASGKEKIILKNIDVTVPFFIVKYKSLKEDVIFNNGIDIIWNNSKLTDNDLNFNIYNVKKKEQKFNDVTTKNDCVNDSLLNTTNKIEIKINFSWSLSSKTKESEKHQEKINKFNTEILNLRKLYHDQKKEIINLLTNKTLLNEYHDDLVKAMMK